MKGTKYSVLTLFCVTNLVNFRYYLGFYIHSCPKV